MIHQFADHPVQFGQGEEPPVAQPRQDPALHYLRAVAATGSRDGLTVMRQMKATRVDDDYAQDTVLRQDGRLMKDYLLAEVKQPGDVKQGWDLLTVREVLPAASVILRWSTSACVIPAAAIAVGPATRNAREESKLSIWLIIGVSTLSPVPRM